MHEEEISAAMEGREGADRMALGLQIIPDKNRGDMDVVATLQAENAKLKEALKAVVLYSNDMYAVRAAREALKE